MASTAPAGARPRLSTGDLALGAGLLIVSILSGLFIDAARPDTVDPSSWWHWVLIVGPPLLVVVRRLHPAAITAVATVVQCLIWVTNLPEVLLSMVVILYTAAESDERGLRVAVGASVVLTVVTAVGVRIADDVTLYQLPLVALTCGVAIVLGRAAARQRYTARQLAVAVTEERLRSEYDRADAVAAERSHIARELHDIIGHTLSVIAVRAEAADRVADTKPDAPRAAITAIATAARSALTETRRVLGGLRAAGDLALSPPADLDAIRRMVRDLREAGVAVTLSEQGCDDHRPAAVVAGGAYRIVQESLTNAVKHGGPGVTVEVSIVCSAQCLVIVVADDGAGQALPDGPATSPGSGLAGMTERATVLGGTLTTERRPDGGFVVKAKLPNPTE